MSMRDDDGKYYHGDSDGNDDNDDEDKTNRGKTCVTGSWRD